MPTTTLDWLSDIGDKPDNYGNVYLNMKFGDGTIAYKAGKPADMEKHEHALRSFEESPEPQEFTFEATDKTTQKGEPKFKLVGYPGWTAQSQGGGSERGGGGSWYNSEEGVRFTAERSDRRTALMQAVEMVKETSAASMKSFNDEAILLVAEDFFNWLRSTAGAGSPLPSPAPAHRSAVVPAREKATEVRNEGTADREWGAADDLGKASAAPCSHTDTSPLKPDGKALPNGFLRCLACGMVHKAAA